MDKELKIAQDCVEELEKQLIGQDLYKYAYKLPLIIINNDSKDSYYRPRFRHYVEMIREISELAGQELYMLNEEIYKIYEIRDSSDKTTNKLLIDFTVHAVGQIKLSYEQSTKMLVNLDDKNKTLIKGEEYCFIAMMLNSIFSNYSFVFNAIMIKRYANDEFLETMRERFSFLLSTEFQFLRKIFKSVECHARIESSDTLH